MSPPPQRSARARRAPLFVVAQFVVVGLSLVAVPLVVPAGFGAGVAAADVPPPGVEDPTAPCFDGAPPRTGATLNGPSPVGRCEPSTGQKVVDNFVWAWILGLLACAFVVMVRWLRHGSALDEPSPEP